MTLTKLLLWICLLVCWTASAMAVELNPHHPDRYVVVKGDTLWDISAKFLQSPWLWPEVWHANPQIANPHLIYPGDLITLIYVDGKPQLRLHRGGVIDASDSGLPVVKLSPMIRPSNLDRAIPTIPLDAIQQFLTKPLVVGKDEMAGLPYILQSADEHIVTGAGDRVYVRAIQSDQPSRFNIFRPGEPYTDPESGENLGYAALHIGTGDVQQYGDPATLLLTATTREATIGDRLWPVGEEETQIHFVPHAPEQTVEGRILAVVDGVTQIGQYQVVVINRGSREGIGIGHVLAIYQWGETVRDLVSDKLRETVKLPDERAGELMVFRAFEKVSFALVMKATRPIHLLDAVRNP